MPSDKNRIYLLGLAILVGAATLYFNSKKGADFPAPSTSNQEIIVTNSASADTITTASGLQYRVLTEGSGTESPGPTNVVTVHYSGKLTNGVEFDSSYQRNQPASFPVNGVIRGWTEALQLMHVGDKWELTIPPDLGYGSRGAGNAIPPDATLIFEVELLEIK
ncbi:MAG TPA: FKBP-type peptidyl-prolyl cis-trans isomerase [Candidatus Lambdaproteobacteria bacterium]|nr:FKBP-type peptidyl-prolyl cis-trans isomerase [Candidatus Lambdaproteobacteria bacterium]HIB44682.1 FKBP-type peptidyl-prolyl cis-trans isomerase [Candidatus Lambdaproteobacteria bacterium]HIO11540.1 FKBP-type peptidyl-prolyl cis-trans isomerase [Deltaproteobacteria bacterium]